MKKNPPKSQFFKFLKRNPLWRGPTKGGDGGVSVVVAFEDATNSPKRANKRKVLVCCPEKTPGLIATQDPFDRAHETKDGAYLIPAAEKRGDKIVATRIPGAAARLYPAPYMVSRWTPDYKTELKISADSQWDWLDTAQRRLAGIPGIGKRDNSSLGLSVQAAMALLPTRNDETTGPTLRDDHVIHGSRQDEDLSRCTPSEIQHEKDVQAFLTSREARP